jgi:thiol-disulfide isomerase/thioredoxin
VLENVALEKIKDEAFWGLAYWVATKQNDVNYSMQPAEVLYKMLLPFLQGASFEEIQQQNRRVDVGKSGDSSSAELRSPQRSSTGHLRCLIEALQYLMRRRGVGAAVRKELSLLLRLEMMSFVVHDLRFVQQLSTAERTVLHIACRQIAYSTSKLGLMMKEQEMSEGDATHVLSLQQVTTISRAIDMLRDKMARLPCGDAAADVAPPPLVLCEAEADKLHTSINTLLGPMLITKTAFNKNAMGQSLCSMETQEALQSAEVVGLYFTASWCGPCKQATPLLVDAYTTLRKKHGKAFEIVCISHDGTEEAFQKYYQQMPWLALPFGSLQKTVRCICIYFTYFSILRY